MTYLSGLGATDVRLPAPKLGSAQAPVYPLQVGSHGSFNEVRRTPADGACGVGTYPCTHPGVDVVGYAGTTVVAPENGKIVRVSDGNGSPFGGYGPWVIVIQGASGKYHLLGHLDPAYAAMGPQNMSVTAGQPIGKTSAAHHTHWEVRKRDVPLWSKGESNDTNNQDPVAWLRRAQAVSGIFGGLVIAGGALVLALMYRRSKR